MAVRVNTTSSAISDRTLIPVANEQISDVSASVGLTAATYLEASMALIQAVTQNVRWRDDGTAPDATTGMQLAAGSDFWYTGDLSAIRFFEESASAEINIATYREA